MNPIFTKQMIKDVTVNIELNNFIINTKFVKSNYQLVLIKTLLENKFPDDPISKDVIVNEIQKMNPDQTDLKRLIKNCDNSVFRDTRKYFMNNWVIKSECHKWIKLNVEITKDQKLELINIINNRLINGDL